MADPSPPPRTFRTTLLLAAALSLMLLLGWAGYLILAPSQPALHETADTPKVLQAPISAGGIRLLAPRDMLPEQLLQQFEENTGFHVTVETFETDASALRRLTDASIAFDAAIVPGVVVARLAHDGRLATLSPTRIANANDLEPALVAIGADYDPGNRHSLVFAWEALGLAYDPDKIAARLGAERGDPSWRWVFDPALAAKLADCGIEVDDNVAEGFAAALASLHLPITTKNVADYETAAKQWDAVRADVGTFGGDDVVDALASGRVCLALTSSSRAYRARLKAQANGGTQAVTFAVPKEGSAARHTFLVIPVQAQNTRKAEALFSFLLRPDTAARVAVVSGLVPSSPPATLRLGADVRADPAFALRPQAGQTLAPEMDPGPELAGLRERFWHLIAAPRSDPAHENH